MITNRYNRLTAAQLSLRLGLAFVFAYAAIASFADPLTWAGYLPHFVLKLIDPTLAIKATALVEIVLAAWLLIGKYTRYAALVSTLMLIGILASNLGELTITFRDVGLIAAALALACLA